MRRDLGRIGAPALHDFAIELYANPCARKIQADLAAKDLLYFETMQPGNEFRRDYRDEVFAELRKLESIER
jgi:hypothetical protein